MREVEVVKFVVHKDKRPKTSFPIYFGQLRHFTAIIDVAKVDKIVNITNFWAKKRQKYILMCIYMVKYTAPR